MLLCLVLALIISRLESQSKFQMFILCPGRHIGVPRMYTNIAFILGSVNFWETFTTNIWSLWKHTDLKLRELSNLAIFYNVHHNFFSFFHWLVFDLLLFILLRDSKNDLYPWKNKIATVEHYFFSNDKTCFLVRNFHIRSHLPLT